MISRIGYNPKVQTLKNNIYSQNNSVTNPSTSRETTKAFEFPKFANVYFMGENNLSKAKNDEIILTDYPKYYRDFKTGNSIYIYNHPNSTKKKLEYTYRPDCSFPIEIVRYAKDGKTPVYKENYEYQTYGQFYNATITCESLDGITKSLGEQSLTPINTKFNKFNKIVRIFPKTGTRIESYIFKDRKPVLSSDYYNASGKKFRHTRFFPNSTQIEIDEIYYPNGRVKARLHNLYASAQNFYYPFYEKSYFDEDGKMTKYIKNDPISNCYEITKYQKNSSALSSIVQYTDKFKYHMLSERYYKPNGIDYKETTYEHDKIKSVTIHDKVRTFTIEFAKDGKTPILESYYTKDNILLSQIKYDEDGGFIDEKSNAIDKSQYPKEYVDPKTKEKIVEKIIIDKDGLPKICTVTYRKNGRLRKETFSYPETTIIQLEKVYDRKGKLIEKTIFDKTFS